MLMLSWEFVSTSDTKFFASDIVAKQKTCQKMSIRRAQQLVFKVVKPATLHLLASTISH